MHFRMFVIVKMKLFSYCLLEIPLFTSKSASNKSFLGDVPWEASTSFTEELKEKKKTCIHKKKPNPRFRIDNFRFTDYMSIIENIKKIYECGTL